MRLTKLEHAALLLEDSGKKLFLDPGAFTSPLTDAANTAAVVITHEHADHWKPEQLNRILAVNPDVPLLAPQGVATAAGDIEITVVRAGDTVEAGPFTLRFFGGKHAVIHETIPVVDNVGVLINDALYYADDSFAIPEGVAVDVLAVPAGAPWMKMAETMDYVLAVKPKRSFPTYFFPLEPGDSLEM